jgi:hypothetical protein
MPLEYGVLGVRKNLKNLCQEDFKIKLKKG